ncbi:MAG: hypothetical protein JNL77_00865 [Nitrosomonas sp.]|nr:hypothetical protein [Nitrosomonas sp.]
MSNDRHNRGGIRIDLEHGTADTSAPGNIAIFPIPNTTPGKIKTLRDFALSDIKLSDFSVVQAWRDQLFDPEWIPEVCDELPCLLTEFLRRPEYYYFPGEL